MPPLPVRHSVAGMPRALTALLHPDQRLNRWLYAGGRPNRVARALNGLWARLAGAGAAPARMATLEVVGRTSGRTLRLPVVVADVDGQRFLVSMLGEQAAWVANVRAARGHAVLRHGGAEDVLLREVAVADRPPILRRYLQLAPGAVPHFPVGPDAPLDAFTAIADRYPAFRVEPFATS